jgi:hypothetical protein
MLIEGKKFSKSSVKTLGLVFMKFQVFDKAYIWFVGLKQRLTAVYKDVFRINAEFLSDWAEVQRFAFFYHFLRTSKSR